MQNTSSEDGGAVRVATMTDKPEVGGGGPTSAASVMRATLESLRPYQWLKNGLVFVPLAAAHRLGDMDRLGAAVQAFIAFSLCASSIYVLNDIFDAPADRQHPHKRYRAIASGRLPRLPALILVPLLLMSGLATAAPLGAPVAIVLGLYVVVMIAYSLRLKTIVLLDGFVLAGGYALRVVAGGLAVGVRPSARLLAFCIFLFFSLALIKRYAELSLLRIYDGPEAHARSYLLQDQELIMALGISSGIMSVLVLALYMSAGPVQHLYAHADYIWGTCVLLLYWISHMWLAAHRGKMTDDPLVFAIRDRVSLILIALMGVSAWLAL